jgi:hypothetical protein
MISSIMFFNSKDLEKILILVSSAVLRTNVTHDINFKIL